MKNIKLLLVLSLLVFVPAVLVGCSISEAQYKIPNAYLTIDINPSVEIITDEEGLVSVVTPLNEDAEVLLIDVDFTGMSVDEATNLIVEAAIEMGYLDFSSENAIIITAEAGTETENLIKTLKEKVEAFVAKRKMNIEVLKASFEATPDMEALADELGISIGKLKLITVAMANNSELTLEVGAEMSVRDINSIIIDARKEVRDFYKVEFHDQYRQLKNELRLNHIKDKTTLLNDVIQNAETDAFAEFDLTTEQIIEIKALYLAYFDELLAIDLTIPNDDENSNQELEGLIAEMNEQRKTIMEKIRNELGNMKNNQMGKVDRQRMQSRIKDYRDELKDINDEIAGIFDELEDISIKHRFQWRFNNHRKINKPYSPIKDLQNKYQELLDEYGIELNAFEKVFEEIISKELDALQEQYKQSLENYKEEFKTQLEIIKEQLKAEKQALKELWRKK